MAIEDYELLQHCKVVLNPTGLGYTAPLLTSNRGAGYKVGVVTAPYGLKNWTMTANVLPKTSDYLIEYDIDGITYTDTHFDYLFNFYQRHLMLGNKPFLIKDADYDKKFLVSFSEPNISFERFSYKLYSGGLNLEERRVRDLVFNSDGSVFDDNPPAVTVFEANTVSNSVIQLTMAAIDLDTVTNYEVEFTTKALANPDAAPGTDTWAKITAIDTPTATYNHTGLEGNKRYYYRFRVKDDDDNYSAWALANALTLPTPDTTDPEMTYFDAQAQIDITQIKIFFAASDNQTVTANLRYDLQWSVNGIVWTNLLTKQTATSPVTHSGRDPGTEYFYRMRVWDEADNNSGWSTDSATTLPDNVMPVIDSFSATGGSGQNTIAATFHDNIAVTSLDLQWSADAVGSAGWFYLLNNQPPTTPTTLAYTDSPLPDATQRFYRLRVRDAAGNTTGFATDDATTSGGGSGTGATWEDDNSATWEDDTPIEYRG